MHYLILYAALIGAASAYIGRPSYAGSLSLNKEPSLSLTETTTAAVLPEELLHTKASDEESTSSSSSSSTSSPSSSPTSSTTTTTTESMKDPNIVQEIVSELPITLPPLLQELDEPKRRVITYDQRQEGQYNIRADLDNFMFLLIPTAPADNFNILDILSKSGLRRSAHSSSKNKKKHYSSGSSLKPDGSLKYRQSMKVGDYGGRQHEHSSAGSSSRLGDFIEGRTPYHVDISALNEDEIQARLNPDRQVDVLPPSYPLAYQHLMKPFLEADGSIIQALPPADMGSRQSSESSPNTGFYRFARYIRGDNFLDSNRVTNSNRLGSQQPPANARRITQIPIYRSDLSLGAAQLYPPLDVPHFSFHTAGRNFEDKSANSGEEVEAKQTLDGGGDLTYEDVFLPSVHIRPLEDDLELDLHTDSLIDGEAKALLSDGIERCAPGKRRDSYGVCREIEGY